ncbi:hypothetical protein QWJ46_16890 [Rhizobium sp. CBN3]|uniref:hypothetical protein n=1 Tax=Rhizobium sp. CBN3 TaxID=3058045 RepID=UPI0026725C60|nr:hypothetical protein [Rhizobium sp. CBN3]MDO3434359.1 hypothetical protein [Rhizobium sp. CBN3]
MISQRRQLRILPQELDAIAAKHGIGLHTGASVATHECPECRRVLAIAEVIERYCAHCGNIAPREVNL